MPPKVAKKTQDKAVKKVVEDKTFGLKNKGKSAKVKQYVQQVSKQAQFIGKSRTQVEQEAKRKAEKEAIKAAKEQAAKENAAIFKGMEDAGSKLKASRAPVQQQPKPGEDPKSILCIDFKHGNCNKGKNCRFSHDLNIERKTTKIDMYTDPRPPALQPKTDIVCTHFLDAVEQHKYGWLWVCPNKGEKCEYRHALPPGYVLKEKPKERGEDEEEEEQPDSGDIVEQQRAKLDLTKCTPLTHELFLQWREQNQARREEQRRKQRELEASKGSKSKEEKRRKNIGMSGRALFAIDSSIFVDDEAGEEKYEIQETNESEWDDLPELANPSDAEESDSDGMEAATQAFEDELFLDDEQLPSDDDDENEHPDNSTVNHQHENGHADNDDEKKHDSS